MKHSYLNRHTPLVRRNRARARALHARNFGERAEAVRAMDCLTGCRCLVHSHVSCDDGTWDEHHARCEGPTQAAHVIARGMGGAKGDRRQLVPLCARHHEEAGEGSWKDQQPSKRAAFEKRYGLDLKAEAERIAIELDGRELP
jgi:hypothetical protein